ncbi:unnamed protein product, partial [Meganyctiphanes norvegica]
GDLCPKKFIRLGNFCYYFSDVEQNWVGASGFCKGIGAIEDETILLAVLDSGLSPHDNQLLLSNISERGDYNSYWLGGSLDVNSMVDSRIWRWTDQGNREVDHLANYWNENQPSTDDNCLSVSKSYYSSNRYYVRAADCHQPKKIICQLIPKGFRTIVNGSFYFSYKNNITPKKTWQEARDFCISLQPPKNFDHVDLAVLGLKIGTDQELLKEIAQQGDDVWLGGHFVSDEDDGLIWIDGRSIDQTSYFWHSDISGKPADDSAYYITDTSYFYYSYATVTSTNGHARSSLKYCYTGTDTRGRGKDCSYGLHFVCQAFKSDNNTIN